MNTEKNIDWSTATYEEIKEFRNSFNPDEMGGQDIEIDLTQYELSEVSINGGYDYSRLSPKTRLFAEKIAEYGLILVPKLTAYNFTDRNNDSRVQYIVNHYFGGLGTAESVAYYFSSGYWGASAHLCVDETKYVYLSVDFADVAWHCGDKGVGKMKGIVANSNSIGIEARPYKIDKSTASSAACKDWYFGEEVKNNLLVVNYCLMEVFNLGIDKVTSHYLTTNKLCPRPWVGDDINTYYGVSGNQKWAEFIEELGDFEMTQEQFNKMFEIALNTYFAVPRGDNPSDWAKKEGCTEWSKQNKIINGDGVGNYNWQNFVTREALSAILYRGVKNGVFTNEKD